MKLLILPHAGGSARSYFPLKRYLPGDYTIVPLELAGRGKRIGEACYSDIPACVDDLIQMNQKLFLGEPYAILGHSMGTMLAVELVRQIREKKLHEPVHVFLSGKTPPSANENSKYTLFGQDKEQVIDFFKRRGLIPVLSDETFMNMLYDILYQDVCMTQKYVVEPGEFQFECPITVLYGTEDEYLQGCDLGVWIPYTTKTCEIVAFQGGHFYYREQMEAFSKVIMDQLQKDGKEQ